LSACSLLGPDLQYETDYANHEPLHVFGYPSTGSLQVVQEVVWRIADGKAGDRARSVRRAERCPANGVSRACLDHRVVRQPTQPGRLRHRLESTGRPAAQRNGGGTVPRRARVAELPEGVHRTPQPLGQFG
jgi:hypothetical protein